MLREKLKWNVSGDYTVCGRYMIQSETERGSPRFHYAMWRDPEATSHRDSWVTIGEDYGTKHQARRAAERHLNGETP